MKKKMKRGTYVVAKVPKSQADLDAFAEAFVRALNVQTPGSEKARRKGDDPDSGEGRDLPRVRSKRPGTRRKSR